MDLKNKKILFLGDSITHGNGTSGEDYTFWSLIGKNTGAKCVGYGVSGTRIAHQLDKEEYFEKLGCFVDRADTMDTDADAVVVFGGTNDFGHGDAPFGKSTDKTADTYCGALNVLCEKLITKYPKALIVFMTPLHRLNEDNTTVNDRGLKRDHSLKDYVDAMIEACAYYSIPVIDLFRTSGLQPNVPIIKEMYVPDGLHPNDEGHKILAKRIENFFLNI